MIGAVAVAVAAAIIVFVAHFGMAVHRLDRNQCRSDFVRPDSFRTMVPSPFPVVVSPEQHPKYLLVHRTNHGL